MKKRVAVGLSGGVDSAVSAAVLKEQGCDVVGVYLECWKEPGCKTEEDRKDALEVALKLKIPFKVLDYRKEYKRKVVDYFYSEYKKGLTPNPDVMCNAQIKFGMFYEWMKDNKFDYMATGHYARIKLKLVNHSCARTDSSAVPATADYLRTRRADRQGGPSSAHLRKLLAKKVNCVSLSLLQGIDKKKDQSYFLYRLKVEQLKRILFPVGEMTKAQVRRKARELELKVADKPDSQGICFIGKVDVREFLKKRLGEKKGEVVDAEGEVIGEHKGIWFYTVGQRHGFTINSKSEYRSSKIGKRPPLYVIEKDVKKNRLVVGEEQEVYRDEFEVGDLNWINRFKIQDSGSKNIRARIRHGGELVKCRLKIRGSEPLILVKLERPVKGVAAGQSAVFYDEEVCLGGGVII